jgi:NAD-reducing hydrogenase large subunit
MGMVNPEGLLSMYAGKIRIVNAVGEIVADQLDPATYHGFHGRSGGAGFLPEVALLPADGLPGRHFRVGPLARMNIISRCGTEMADQEWAEFRMLQRGAVLSSFQYHYARLIEIVYCIERIRNLLNDPDILSEHVRSFAEPNAFEGVGMSEAPRGTLLHHYKIDKNGRITWANMIIATGNNNLAMNKGVYQVAKHFVRGEKIQEGMLNRVEAVIRTFDPCLSCSTHAIRPDAAAGATRGPGWHAVGRTPAHLITITGQNFGYTEQLSAPVETAVDEAVALVRRLLNLPGA